MPPLPQVRQLLDVLASMEAPPVSEQTPDQARAQFRALAAMGEPTDEPASIQDGVTDDGVAVRVYRPDSTDVADGRPLLVWYHGGGWVIGDLDTADSTARALCVRAGVVVVSVDYRLAPEHPFPAALEDALGALRWSVAHAAELGADPARVAVGGDSAGGNLAAVVARESRDRDPAPAFQLLVYPVTDCTRACRSHVENAEGYLLTADAMAWFCGHYLGDHDPTDPRASPLHADDLGELAPALVITAEYDPLRDEGEAYAEAMRAAGVDVVSRRVDGQIHGFFGLEGIFDDAKGHVDFAAEQLARALRR